MQNGLPYYVRKSQTCYIVAYTTIWDSNFVSIKMNRQELLEYLRTTDQYQDSIEYWYNCNLYRFDTFVNDIGSCDYFFTELIKRIWKKIYGNCDVESEKIGINLLKFLCGIGDEICFDMYGNTSALDNATVYTEGMLDITVKRDKDYNYNGKFIIDCDLDVECYKIDASWCINCNYIKINDSKRSFIIVRCYNCTNCITIHFCANCIGCFNCGNCKNCIDCKKCKFDDNCIKCLDLQSCNNCKNCKSCGNCNNMTDCSSCNDCNNCKNCNYMKKCKDCNNCKTCHSLYNIPERSQCDKCSNCENYTNCENCKNCSECIACSYCSNSKACQNCKKCLGCVNNVECNNNTDCTDCIKCENCKNCTTCEECKRCVDCSNCKKCSGCKNCSTCKKCSRCKNCSNCESCINQKNKKDTSRKLFNRKEVDISKERVVLRHPLSVDLSVNGDRIDIDNTYIQYYDSDDNLLFQGICQYKHPRVNYENCMNFAIGQGWFYYADTHQPRCYVNLSTKSKYSITVQDIANFCKNNYSIEDFIMFIQECTKKMRNSFISIYDRSGKFDYNEDTITL